MVRPTDRELTSLLRQFVRVRILQMNNADIGLFQFDFDLTWMGFFLDADERIYSRYGGRDGGDPEGRLSVAGLKYTMREVLQYHRQQPADVPAPPRKPVLPGDLFPAKEKGCLHCHQVWEGLRKQARRDGRFTTEMYDVYPLPENVGLRLDVDRGNKVVKVIPDSPSSRAGVRVGDRIQRIADLAVCSQGDVMWALHNAPNEGQVAVSCLRDGQLHSFTLDLGRGWKKTDLSWRASMWKEKK